MPSIAVLSSLALKGVLEDFKPSFERSLGTPLELRFDATQAILARLKNGEQADLLILTAEAMQNLEVKQLRDLGSSGVGVAVRAGARKPDIGSVEALKRALTAAKSVAHSKVGASGIYFAELLGRLDITLQKRIVVEKGPVGLVVASGEAEIGVQQLCELAPVRGIDIVGPLPDAVQKLTYFSAGIPAAAKNPHGAAALLELLQSDSARTAMRQGGLEPAHGPSGPAWGRTP
jgi:molybdate transport system substrate-binding protein